MNRQSFWIFFSIYGFLLVNFVNFSVLSELMCFVILPRILFYCVLFVAYLSSFSSSISFKFLFIQNFLTCWAFHYWDIKNFNVLHVQYIFIKLLFVVCRLYSILHFISANIYYFWYHSLKNFSHTHSIHILIIVSQFVW